MFGFTGVSAIEISLMEHRLMNSRVDYAEDVIELCDVHANLASKMLLGRPVEDTEPLATQFASSRMKIWLSVQLLIRIRRLFGYL